MSDDMQKQVSEETIAAIGEFNDLAGNVGEAWDVDQIELIDPETMNEGDERNDDAMKEFLAAYVLRICYADELQAARDEGFCEETA